MKRFLVVIEKANGNYSAYSPDLPGCVATGRTVEETESNMYEAIRLHIEGRIKPYREQSPEECLNIRPFLPAFRTSHFLCFLLFLSLINVSKPAPIPLRAGT